jgi:hypothetical protein
MAKRLGAAVSVAAFLCSLSWTQEATLSSTNGQSAQSTAPTFSSPSSTAGNQPEPGTPRIAPGIVIPVKLTKTVDARKAKPGDQVIVTVTQDLKTNSGEVIVPKDTKIVGHVTEAQARTKEQKESELGIAFDDAMATHGELKQLMSIQAIIAPPDDDSGNGGGNAQGGPVTGGGTTTSPMSGRSPLSGAAPPRPLSTSGTDAQAAGNARPPINGNTQGVIGMPGLKLEANTQNATLGSVVSSGKGSVKLESGTLMLLHVN